MSHAHFRARNAVLAADHIRLAISYTDDLPRLWAWACGCASLYLAAIVHVDGVREGAP